MENNNLENIGFDKDFVDEHGENATLHIEPMNDSKDNFFGNTKYKLANIHKKDDNLSEQNKKKNIFTRDIGFKMKKNPNNVFLKDIGVKSSGFAQVASLAFIVALAGIFVLYLMFRY